MLAPVLQKKLKHGPKREFSDGGAAEEDDAGVVEADDVNSNGAVARLLHVDWRHVVFGGGWCASKSQQVGTGTIDRSQHCVGVQCGFRVRYKAAACSSRVVFHFEARAPLVQ